MTKASGVRGSIVCFPINSSLQPIRAVYMLIITHRWAENVPPTGVIGLCSHRDGVISQRCSLSAPSRQLVIKLRKIKTETSWQNCGHSGKQQHQSHALSPMMPIRQFCGASGIRYSTSKLRFNQEIVPNDNPYIPPSYQQHTVATDTSASAEWTLIG